MVGPAGWHTRGSAKRWLLLGEKKSQVGPDERVGLLAVAIGEQAGMEVPNRDGREVAVSSWGEKGPVTKLNSVGFPSLGRSVCPVGVRRQALVFCFHFPLSYPQVPFTLSVGWLVRLFTSSDGQGWLGRCGCGARRDGVLGRGINGVWPFLVGITVEYY